MIKLQRHGHVGSERLEAHFVHARLARCFLADVLEDDVAIGIRHGGVHRLAIPGRDDAPKGHLDTLEEHEIQMFMQLGYVDGAAFEAWQARKAARDARDTGDPGAPSGGEDG